MANKYFAIIGENPSKGARSPKLWNEVFIKKKNSLRMIPIDIKKKNFSSIFYKLKKDKNYLGGAVTTPYKEAAYKLLKKNLDNQTKKIKAINCLFRDNKGVLKGCNTDGEAALYVLRKRIKNLKKKKILMLGFGGAGKAVASYFNDFLKKNFILSTRSLTKQKKAKLKFNYNTLKWNDLKNKIDIFDIIINCTSVGFQDKRKSPLSDEITKKMKNKIIFDIIYQPKKTKLLKQTEKNNQTMNGSEMNLIQAALGFCKAVKNSNLSEVYKIMKKI